MDFMRKHSAHLRRLDLDVWDKFLPAVLKLPYPRLEYLTLPAFEGLGTEAGALVPPSVRTLAMWSANDGNEVWALLAGIAEVSQLKHLRVSSEYPLRDISVRDVYPDTALEEGMHHLARAIEKRGIRVVDSFGKVIKLIDR